MKKLSLALASAAVLLSVSPQAEAEVNPWQQCGIGAMIFPDNGAAAAISNIIWDLGTTAVTSATVSEDTCKGASVATAMYINENYEQIETDLAIGEGEHLNAMLDMLAPANRDEAVAELRRSLQIEADLPVVKKAEALYLRAIAFAS
ncbi:DUF3015 family protein [Pseudidiomarina donghaiensis]|uniref:DUF3015 domain-containing protein n=1 Tax=Pseudidiomarina donghaiensis TaxID=519452 RepID=A0A432XH64_9GAMM|nr:DUF3015 family protein [Pseudidiomarina donghaiensis]RUO48020.1 DUF3015 domain-containing protein [Pseudidiomarina donghaiensis]SFV22779.1 Protein of unknown function [Pseudidiomarina donghaiensis]